MQALGCDGADSFVEVELRLREVAVAVAQAVTQASAFCESRGGPGTLACGLSRGTVDAVATAQVRRHSRSLPGLICSLHVSRRCSAPELMCGYTPYKSALADACTGDVHTGPPVNTRMHGNYGRNRYTIVMLLIMGAMP